MNATNNPYSPPTADPGSGPQVAAPAVRPSGVDVAVWLVAISLLLGAVDALSFYAMMDSGSMNGIVFILEFVRLGLLFWICFAIARGRNWARIVLLVITVIGMASLIAAFVTQRAFISIYVTHLDNSAKWMFVTALPTLLGAAACYQLFFPARRWFAR